MGLSYAVARRAGTSRRYALGTAAGRIGGVAQVGGLAAALGLSNEVTDGIYTGERGARSRDGYRLTHRLAMGDAARQDAEQLTMHEREQERDLQRAADRAQRGTTLDEAGRLIGGGLRTVLHPAATVRRATGPGRERISELSGDVAHTAWERARAARDAVAERAGETPTLARSIVAVAGAASHGFSRDARSGRMVHDGRGGVRYLPRVAEAQVPSGAQREPVSTVAAGRLLRRGYHLQYNGDGTVTFWHPERQEPAAPPPETEVEQSSAGGMPGPTPAAPGTAGPTSNVSAGGDAAVVVQSGAAPVAGAAQVVPSDHGSPSLSPHPRVSSTPMDPAATGALPPSGVPTGDSGAQASAPAPGVAMPAPTAIRSSLARRRRAVRAGATASRAGQAQRDVSPMIPPLAAPPAEPVVLPEDTPGAPDRLVVASSSADQPLEHPEPVIGPGGSGTTRESQRDVPVGGPDAVPEREHRVRHRQEGRAPVPPTPAATLRRERGPHRRHMPLVPRRSRRSRRVPRRTRP